MISTHEAEVASRFDALHRRFKPSLARDDYRLRGILDALGPVRGLRILDLGCGKGRFARVLEAEGASVVGIDLSAAMLAAASDLDRVRATARRLPFRSREFDAVLAIEVFEHLDPRHRQSVLEEARRVLRPGGAMAIVDKNLASLCARRPWLPSVAVKRIDEYRGRWMYPRGGPVRERWFWPGGFKAELRRHFEGVGVVHLLSPAERAHTLFRFVPAARLMTLWVARAPGGRHV
jgi:2-polyprenyl-6-hydroxyphenyl methylase/3-demethylubiquinone-9 3-methyltransferase